MGRKMKKKYGKKFFENRGSSSDSAKEIVPIICTFLNPKNVVDVGCGTGEWLYFFKKKGVKQILGVDGPWVKRNLLKISKDEFLPHDLNKKIDLNKKFDLVVSLEVAEHLPEKNAKKFVKTLTGLGDFVLFSAAIPYQGGTNHFNEQWQSYWADLFKKRRFLPN